MINTTERLIALREETKRIIAIDYRKIPVTEFTGAYVFNEADRTKYVKKTSADLRDFYLVYSSNKLKKGENVEYDFTVFKEYCTIINNLMTIYITQTGKWLKIPFGIGLFGISKFKPRYYKPAFVWTKQADGKMKPEIQLNSNPHSQGYVCKFSWDKTKSFVVEKSMWRHSSSTNLKNSMFQAITKLGADKKYQEISREAEMLTHIETTKLKRARKELKDRQKEEE